MLGKLVQVLKPEPLGEYSTKFADLLFGTMGSISKRRVVTLDKMPDEYNEFWLYASGATRWCPRMSAIAAAFGMSERVIKSEEQMKFDIGDGFHYILQQKSTPHRGEDVLLGAWRRYQNSKIKGVVKQIDSNYVNEFTDNEERILSRGYGQKPKGYDGKYGWEFLEPKVKLSKYRIVVKTDGFINWSDTGIEPFDFKTVEERDADVLNPLLGGKPKWPAVLQGQLTMSAWDMDRFRIIYIIKGREGIKNMMIEHMIYRDEKIISNLKSLALQCVDAVRMVDEYKHKNGIDTRVVLEDEEAKKAIYADIIENMPRLEDCPMKSKGNARYCNERDDCFPGRGKRKSLKVWNESYL